MQICNAARGAAFLFQLLTDDLTRYEAYRKENFIRDAKRRILPLLPNYYHSAFGKRTSGAGIDYGEVV